MKRWITHLVIVTSTIFFHLSVHAEMARICTRSPGSRVNIREGPGDEYPKGLVQVGSGGASVVEFFEEHNFTVSDREKISVYSRTHGTDGYVWYKLGTNQWVAWVRSDFVCRKP